MDFAEHRSKLMTVLGFVNIEGLSEGSKAGDGRSDGATVQTIYRNTTPAVLSS